MKVLTIVGLISSFLYDCHPICGFSTAPRLSFGQSKKGDLPSLFTRLASSTRNPADDRYVCIRCNTQLSSAAKGEEEEVEDNADADVVDDALDAKVDKKLAGRKKRLTMGYQLASMAYVVTSLITLVLHGRLSPKAFYLVFGGGNSNAALILYILKGAASHDRLSSDTYKRLNIAVISYAFTQLVLSTGLPFKVPAFLALVNGIKGYGYGCLGWDKSKAMSTIVTDVKEGIQSTLKGLTVVKAKSAGYIFGTLLLGLMFCFKLKDLVSILVFATTETATASTSLQKLARFGMLATIMYTLKDASDRDRLSGTTFVQLNFLAAAAFLSIALYLLPTIGTMSANSQVLIVGALCVMTLYKGVANMKAKKE